jgi:glycosyltransferase involved in cell wall biosynthesis
MAFDFPPGPRYREAMRISVIVPAFNEAKRLGRCLEHIRAARRAFADLGWDTELIVCDNHSTDATPDIARAAGARVVFEPVNQISRARNRGASVATGDWLIFVDADSYPDPGLFAAVAEAIRSGRVLGGGTTVRMDQTTLITRVLSRVWNLISRARRWFAGSFSFCETQAFRQLGGFSEELFASEEIEFSRRLNRLAGERGRRVVILHRHPLVTSGRRSHLSTPMEYLRLLIQTIRHRGANLKSREACSLWYNGRR